MQRDRAESRLFVGSPVDAYDLHTVSHRENIDGGEREGENDLLFEFHRPRANYLINNSKKRR